MYQLSMFTGSIRGAKFLGSGVNGRVHSIGDGWVLKRATRRDATYSWLEYCKLMQDAGQYQRGMPVIDRLVKTDEGGYVCAMKQLTPYRRSVGETSPHYPTGGLSDDMVDLCVKGDIEFPGFYALYGGCIVMERLVNDYVEYAREHYVHPEGDSYEFQIRDLFNDTHAGNFMMDEDGECIVIDPSNGDEFERKTPELTLQ